MDKYKKELMNQFKHSIGVDSNNFNPELYEKEFCEWLSKYKETGKFYFKWLKESKILLDLDETTAEIGKGKYDTLTLNCNTTLISEYMDDFKHLELKNKRIYYDFTVFNGIPLLRSKNPFDIVKGVDVFITQNPYCMPIMINWPSFYNYGESDFIVGLYGNNYDKDKAYKLKKLKIMREIIRDDFDIEEVTNGDIYCYALSTQYTKRKQKVLNQKND